MEHAGPSKRSVPAVSLALLPTTRCRSLHRRVSRSFWRGHEHQYFQHSVIQQCLCYIINRNIPKSERSLCCVHFVAYLSISRTGKRTSETLTSGGASISSGTPWVGTEAGIISVSVLKTLPSVHVLYAGKHAVYALCHHIRNTSYYQCCINHICFPFVINTKGYVQRSLWRIQIIFTCLLNNITVLELGVYTPKRSF